MSAFTDRRKLKGKGQDTPTEIWATKVHNQVHIFHKDIIFKYERLMKWVWNNPNGHTPEEIFESLGDEAEGIVEACSLLESLITFTAPHRIYKRPDVEIKIKKSGRVEIVR